MPSYKLIYFNGRGRAETIRLVFAAAGIKYDDHRIEKTDWPALKPKAPWGSLPILEVDGKQLGQSLAIARFAAKEGGLFGKNNFEAAQIDSIVDTVTEIREKGITIAFTPDGPAKDAALKQFKEEFLPAVFPNIEKALSGNPDKSGFLVGSKLSLADIHFYAIAEMLLSRNAHVLDNNAPLKTLFDKVGATPKIAEYLKKRPETPF